MAVEGRVNVTGPGPPERTGSDGGSVAPEKAYGTIRCRIVVSA
jgi:hypothetical protein